MPMIDSNIEQMSPALFHVLFVEDDAADFELCLREFGNSNLKIRAERVSTREEYFARLDAEAYDIIIADYTLPGWTGMDAFEILQQHTKDVPLILMTGALGEEKAVECIKRGITDYVLKKDLNRLPGAVCRALEEKAIRLAHRRAEAALRESEQQFRALADMVASAVFIYQGTQCRYANRAAETLTGYSRNELLALDSWDLVHPDSRSVVIDHGFGTLRGDGDAQRYEIRIITKQGAARWVDITVGKIEFLGKPAGLTTAFDITDHKLYEEGLRRGLGCDPLTGLANSNFLRDLFEREATRSARGNRSFALLLLEVNELEKIKEQSGSFGGSQALCKLANVIGISCRATDTALRTAENEFAMILPETSTAGVDQLVRRINQRLKKDADELLFSVNAGAGVFPQDGGTLEQLLTVARQFLRGSKVGTTEQIPGLDLKNDHGKDNFEVRANSQTTKGEPIAGG